MPVGRERRHCETASDAASGGHMSRHCETASDAASGGHMSRHCETASDAASGGHMSRHCETASDAASGGIAIGGVQWTTLIDYPGKVAATLFTVGCNFRCPFCHNPELVDPDRLTPALDEGEILNRLRERAGFIDGVVISGGEPTIHPLFPTFVERVKQLGLLVKLDTNGSHPNVLGRLLAEHAVDYVAMDVKAPSDDYERLTGGFRDLDAIERAIDLIVKRAPDYEFRTTAAPTLDHDSFLRIADRLSGARRYVLQAFRVPEKGLVDPTWETRPGLSEGELGGLWDEIRSCFADGGVRG